MTSAMLKKRSNPEGLHYLKKKKIFLDKINYQRIIIKIKAFYPEVDRVKIRINTNHCTGDTLPTFEGKRLK